MYVCGRLLLSWSLGRPTVIKRTGASARGSDEVRLVGVEWPELGGEGGSCSVSSMMSSLYLCTKPERSALESRGISLLTLSIPYTDFADAFLPRPLD